MQNDLIIFVKNPVLGTAKTRLAVSIGNEAALVVYLQLLAYTKDVALSIDVNRSVWYSSNIDKNDMWTNEDFTKRLQFGDDLGEKMKNAFRKTFEEQNSSAVVIIGSDCAELEPNHIKQAFEELLNSDVVIGPARDGGYYLLGMSKFHPQLFESISWSTSSVAEQTIEIVNKLGLSYQLLEELNDVDTVEDWKQVKHRLPNL
ncbi:MAG: TIGR04282 family arsenosugar biosynthesis glycosyltransferase [Balneolaceae bacterium]|nr:TIGR04282 family arsenosugar biosynthesis glycosyltransferase [Balneolaceae bacterium]